MLGTNSKKQEVSYQRELNPDPGPMPIDLGSGLGATPGHTSNASI
jgi:hypothetical protein